MKVLVTGGAGYIGSVTCELLLDAGHEVAIFDNLERGHRAALDPRAAFFEGDLREAGRIAEVMHAVQPEAVMHFAAYALVGESMEHPEMYFRNNMMGGLHLAEAMLRSGVQRIVFSSTCATYGDPDVVPITEDTPQKPTNPYGESKLMFEKTLRWFGELHGFHPIYLRYFNACGATAKFGEDHEPESHLIPIVLQVAMGKRKSVKMFGDDYDTPDGTCLRDYIHIVDLAQAHMLALTTEHSGPFNLGTGQGYSVREVVEAARRVTGKQIEAEMAPRRPGDPPELVAASGRAVSLLKWTPRHSDLDSIIESAWRWHLAHPQGYGDGSGR